jgi:hypothetical protein
MDFLPEARVESIKSDSPSATALLQVLSMLDDISIPGEILTKGAKDAGLKDYPLDEPAYFEARKVLVESSLVTRDKELTILHVHRSVQKVVRNQLDLPLFRKVFNAATILLSAVWPFNDNNYLEIWFQKVDRYQPQLNCLGVALEGRGIETVKPSLLIAALFNECSW